jgi:hypothetical protein
VDIINRISRWSLQQVDRNYTGELWQMSADTVQYGKQIKHICELSPSREPTEVVFAIRTFCGEFTAKFGLRRLIPK